MSPLIIACPICGGYHPGKECNMNKYADRSKATRIYWTPKPKELNCAACERVTKHDYLRVGVNGPLFACRECGTERLVK